MRKILLILLIVQSILIKAQDVFVAVNFVESVDSIKANLVVTKETQDTYFITKSKTFINKTMISLDKGNYNFSFIVNDELIHTHNHIFEYTGEVLIFNLYYPPIKIKDANLNMVIVANIGMVEIMNRQWTYIEF